MKKKILVTGSTGFVGRQVIRALTQNDVELSLIVREKSKDKVILFPNVSNVITTKNLFSESSSWWAEKCKGIDIVVHLAWYTKPNDYLKSSKNKDCLKGSINLAKGAIQAGIKRFLGIGTCVEYDLTNGIVSVNTPLKPTTPYATSKATLFKDLQKRLSKNFIEFVWCRLFYLHGEGEDPRRLIPYLRKKLELGEFADLSNGNQIRDFLDVRKAGDIISKITLNNQVGAVNVCSGISTTVRQLAEKVADEYGRRDLLRFGTRPDNLTDVPSIIGVPNIKIE